ncbi:monovalent cation/H(+) antiporter subunit G [Silanimonas lenta]|uniref:monovalent cation/H(+) antiporter subunit G n=1 Tax=Silanimonas lenta TaxID=265429 RepID=UPI001FDEE491|nr:monovalent cation/H(+) antiporter subunit G [Silanimonas lenta]
MTDIPLWLDLLVAALLVAGAGFTLVGAFGLLKLGDLLKRLHGPTKASTLGVGLSLLASMLWFAWEGNWTGREFLVTAFVFVTAPVSAHLMVTAAMRVVPGCAPPPRPVPPQD